MTVYVQFYRAPQVLLACRLVPHGGTGFEAADAEHLSRAFEQGLGAGLLCCAARWPFVSMRKEEATWRDFARHYLYAALDGAAPSLVADASIEAELWAERLRFLEGFKDIDAVVIGRLWAVLREAVADATCAAGCSLPDYLGVADPQWRALGRLCLSLAENPASSEHPFALLATYTSRLSAEGRAQHIPLAAALAGAKVDDAGGAATKAGMAARLAATLADCAASSPFIAEQLRSGQLLQPQAITAADAYRLLRDVSVLEGTGAMVRIPDWWDKRSPPRVQVEVTLGEDKPKGVGIHALVDFRARVCLQGQELADEDWQALQEKAAGLVLLRGRWVEADGARLREVLGFWHRAEALAEDGGLNFATAARLMAGAKFARGGAPAEAALADASVAAWSAVKAGAWLREAVRAAPEATDLLAVTSRGQVLAQLRPYQNTGVAWLARHDRLGFGACLADDMGLGKTLQVLAFLVWLHGEAPDLPSLIVAPATLIGNWQAEAQRFTPSLRVCVAHPSAMRRDLLVAGRLPAADVVVTTYGSLLRYGWLRERQWQVVVLDEAQAIKNPEAQITVAAKALMARQRVALTGTPVENRPLDLWSIMDFLNPGLLGQARQFTEFLKTSRSGEGDAGFGAMRALVRPFLLRRLKTDKTLLPDLPDKVEVDVACFLTPLQVALYEKVVAQLRADLKTSDGSKRRGVVLSALMKLKQVCNHPSQLTGDQEFAPRDSGKMQVLGELVETIALRGEKLLVFSQYRDIIAMLARELAKVFGRPGLVLHGDTPVKERRALVEAFQKEDGPPFFVLSLKAGGTGLTLTAASHVVHFDRWWNPAVEDQATDRAFRLGQHRNVLVHKFACAGTMEEKVAAMLQRKRGMAADILHGDSEVNLTELDDQALLALVALDGERAAADM